MDLTLHALMLLVLLGAPLWAVAGIDELEYAGSDQCAECHREKYDGWRETFHATVVQDARKNPAAILGDFSIPGLGFSIEDVEYTIGRHWDQRYMKRIGDDFYVLPKLWNVQAQNWRPYNVWSWQKKPYGKYCKGCHVTAYDPQANVTEAENQIGCEACHGPGWAHAKSAGAAPIVNPRKLSEERADMICAACHVRGSDLGGKFFFPIGFIPGEDLGRYYVPNQKAEGESNSAAILRLFKKWETAGKLKCEVCGIFGAADTAQGESEESKTLEFCFGCHDFKDNYPQHHHHSEGTKLACFDCHVQVAPEIMNPRNRADIHTYGYFLQHTDGCYDSNIEMRCAKCHADKDVKWARRTVSSWRAPVIVDH